MKSRFAQKSLLGLALMAGMAGGCKKEDPVKPTPPPGCYLTEETASSNLATIYKLDDWGRLASQSELSMFDSVKYSETFYTYNSAGQLIKKAVFRSSEETEREEFIYSGDRKTGSRYLEDMDGDGTLELLYSYTHVYDGAGRISNTKAFRGSSTTELSEDEYYHYDAKGNLVKVEWTYWDDANRKKQGTTEYTYDDKLHPHTAFKFPAMLNWETTVNNILTETERDENGDIKHTYTYTYEYNSNGLPTKEIMTYPGFHYEYNYVYKCM